MKARYLLAATATMLVAGTASAQYIPATYQEPYCREFTKVIDVGGRAQPGYGKACYQPDGSWQIVSDDIPANQPIEYLPAQNAVAYQAVPAYYPTYYQEPYRPSYFSINFSSWDNDRHRHWRGHDRGRHGGWDRGRGHGRHDGRGRGHGRH